MKYNNHNEKPVSKKPQKSRKKKAAHYKSGKAAKRKKRILIFAVEGVLLLIVLIFVFIASTLNKFNREYIDPTDISTNPMDESVVKPMEGYRNIALFGVDARDNKSLGKGTHADVNIICSINNSTGEIRLVSVYRDTYLNIKGESEFNKLTQAYFSGGASQAIGALNKNLDLKITDYVTVNWKAVADAINILGGIDIEITKSEFAGINGLITETVKSTGVGSVHLKSAGMNHLDGVQAVSYARLRLMDTDYKRTERQRKVIGLALEKAKKADVSTLMNLVNTVFPQVSTSLENAEILVMAKDITKYRLAETAGFPFDKDSKVMGKKGDCVIPLGLEQNVSQLHAFLFANEEYTASDTVKTIDQMIKDASGFGAPGTTTKAVASGNTSSTTAAATTQAAAQVTTQATTQAAATEESTTVPETTIIADETTAAPETLSSTAAAETNTSSGSTQSTEDIADTTGTVEYIP